MKASQCQKCLKKFKKQVEDTKIQSFSTKMERKLPFFGQFWWEKLD